MLRTMPFIFNYASIVIVETADKLCTRVQLRHRLLLILR